jgi:outer membrane lipopolysaccharide assembly protein LptE/RlpB
MKSYKLQGIGIQASYKRAILIAPCTLFLVPCSLYLVLLLLACGIYRFNQVSIPPDIKTVKVLPIENKARYINTQLSPQLTDRLRQKIVSQTNLTQVNNDNADYEISAYVSQYDVTTSGISAQQVATNRLTVGVNITLLDRKTPNAEPKNFSISRSFDFSANLTLPQAEQKINDEMIRNLVDEIFNRIFSDWE